MNALMATLDAPQTQTAPLFVLRDVEKQFDNGTLALRGINLAVEAASFVSLLGASGCGKSTILRIVAGLSQPTRGSVVYREVARPRISCVFQEATLMPWASALKNVLLPLSIAGVEKHEAESRARAAMEAVGLADFVRAYPRELSGGMKMRVSLARALVTRPQLLLLDEPFAALDEITRSKLNNDLAVLWREQRFTVLFVTHSVFESVYLSQRVVVLAAKPGRIFTDVTVEAPAARDETFRTSAAYGRQCAAVSAQLKGAMAE